MTFMTLESGVLVLALLIGWEMRRQRVPWRSVIVRSSIVFGLLTAVVVAWRGL